MRVSIITNDLTTAGTNFANIYFTNASQGYTIYGNGSFFNGGGTITNVAAVNQTFVLPMMLGSGDDHVYPGTGSTLTFNGVVNFYAGRFYVDKQAGTIVLNGANTGLGITATAFSWSGKMSAYLNSGGTLILGNKTALGSPNSAGTEVAVDINSSATLQANTDLSGANAINNSVVLGNGGALTVGGANNLEISGNLYNAGGNRSVTINNTASTMFSGGVYLSDASGTGRTLTMNVASTAGTATISGGIANYNGGSGTASGFTKSGTGTLTLSGPNTYSGGTTLSAGQLNINNGGSSSANSAIGIGAFTISGGTIDNTSSDDVTLQPAIAQNWNSDFTYVGSAHNLNLGTGAVTLGANRTLTVSANTLTVGGNISNSGNYSLTKAGIGTLVLTGVNTYSNTTVSAGTLVVGGGMVSNTASALTVGNVANSPATIILTNATLVTGAASYVGYNPAGASRNLMVVGAGGLWNQGGQAFLVGANSLMTNNTLVINNGGVVSNVGNIYMPDNAASVGCGIVVSNGGNFYQSGTLYVGQGAGSSLNYYQVGGLGAGSYATNYGLKIGGASTVNFSNQMVVTNAILFVGGGGLYIGNNTANTNDTVSVLAGGVVNLAGNELHAYEGVANGMTVNNGVVTNVGNIYWGDKGSAISNQMTITGGGQFYGASSGSFYVGYNNGAIGNSIVVTGAGSVLNAGGRTVGVGSGNAQTTNNSLSVSSSGLFTNGSVTVSYGGASSVSHSLTVNGGTAYVNTLTVNNGGVVQLTGGSNDSLYADVISGSSSMVITGAAASASSLIAGWNNSSSSVGPLLVGNLALTKNGSGILTLTNANNYTGATIINAGTISVSSDANLGSAPGSPTAGSLVINNGATLSASTCFTLNANRGMAIGPAGSTLDVASSTLTYNGTIADNGGSGMLTKTSTGNLLLGGANTYSGGTVISAGTLQLGSNTALGGGGATNNSGATLDLNGASINNALSVTGTGVGGNGALINNNAGSSSTVSNNILGISFTAGGTGNLVLTKLDQANSGNFTLTKVGTGTLYLSGTNLNYLMALTVNGGTVVLNKSYANTVSDWAIDRSPVINSGTLRLGAIGEQIQTDQGLTVNGGAFDLGGFGQSINFLAGTGGMVTNSGATAGTLTVGATQFGSITTSSTYSGVICDGTAKVVLTKNGTNVLTLAGTNTYTGNTTIYGGTLALNGSGSIVNTANITLAGGATFDVSGLSSTFALGSGQTLTNTSGTGILAGNVNLASGSLALNYHNGTPSLQVTNGTLNFSGNAVTVNVSGTLARGTYKLISTNAGGLVAGTLPSSVTVNGLGTVVGSLSISNSELYLTVDHPPVAAPMTVTRTAGLRLLIALAEVATNWSDADSDPVTLAGVNLVTTNGVNLATNSTWILYTNSPNVNDQISYGITDGFGGTNIGYINIVVSSSVTGTNSIVRIATGGTNVVTAYGLPGYHYILERATNLAPAVWIDVSTNTAATNGVISAADAFGDLGGTPPASAYYRLKWQP